MSETIEEFYDGISREYTDFVLRCVPRYDEMLSMLFAYMPKEYSPKSILELGCGTGNLTQLIHSHFPHSRITAVDISEECIQVCRERLQAVNIDYIKSDFRDLDFAVNSFDLVISSIAIHHLDDGEREDLFSKLYVWQAPGSILTFCDQFRGETDGLYDRNIRTWREYAFRQGATDKEWEMWMEHQAQHDHHASVQKHVSWLTGAGYPVIDCVWRYLLWGFIYAEKD
ncbi:class I SAM-dependent methyltransferase [Chloroflexota bacterium]